MLHYLINVCLSRNITSISPEPLFIGPAISNERDLEDIDDNMKHSDYLVMKKNCRFLPRKSAQILRISEQHCKIFFGIYLSRKG